LRDHSLSFQAYLLHFLSLVSLPLLLQLLRLSPFGVRQDCEDEGEERENGEGGETL